MNSREAFQKWWKIYWESRDSVPEYSTAIEAWQAACQYKDEQIAELEDRIAKLVIMYEGACIARDQFRKQLEDLVAEQAQRVPEGWVKEIHQALKGAECADDLPGFWSPDFEAVLNEIVRAPAPPAPTGDSISPLQRQMDSAKQEVGSWPKQKREAMRNAINKKGGR